MPSILFKNKYKFQDIDRCEVCAYCRKSWSGGGASDTFSCFFKNKKGWGVVRNGVCNTFKIYKLYPDGTKKICKYLDWSELE